jgi:protein CpxP
MKRTTRRNLLIAGSATTALALGGASLFAAAPTLAGGWMRRHGHGFHQRGHGDPDHVQRHLKQGVEWMLQEVDATDEQVTRVVAIFEDVLAGTDDLHERHRAQREAFGAALAEPEIDRATLETLRADGISMADEVSQRFVTAMADAAEVLTPGQREELLRLHDEFHGGHGRRWFP